MSSISVQDLDKNSPEFGFLGSFVPSIDDLRGKTASMPIEIEKKYRLTQLQRERILRRLEQIGAKHVNDDVEENTLYAGEALNKDHCVLRLRRMKKSAILTFKKRFLSRSAIKHQQEDETAVKNPEAMNAILRALGFTPALVYEKRRQRWRLGDAEIVIDELPFGLFMEIEADEDSIKQIEGKLAVTGLKAERATYPQLTARHGERIGDLVESRFGPTRARSAKPKATHSNRKRGQ